MSQPEGQGLRLRVPAHIRALSFGTGLTGYLLIVMLLPVNIMLPGIVLWTWLQLRGVFYSPAMTVYENGIETQRFGVRYFTPWNRIDYVSVGKTLTQIAPRPINPAIKILLYNYLMIMSWRSNYDEALAIFEANIPAFRKNDRPKESAE